MKNDSILKKEKRKDKSLCICVYSISANPRHIHYDTLLTYTAKKEKSVLLF